MDLYNKKTDEKPEKIFLKIFDNTPAMKVLASGLAVNGNIDNKVLATLLLLSRGDK